MEIGRYQILGRDEDAEEKVQSLKVEINISRYFGA